MTLLQVVGLILIIIPFIACFIYGLKLLGLKYTLIAFWIILLILIIVGVGAYLLVGKQ